MLKSAVKSDVSITISVHRPFRQGSSLRGSKDMMILVSRFDYKWARSAVGMWDLLLPRLTEDAIVKLGDVTFTLFMAFWSARITFYV